MNSPFNRFVYQQVRLNDVTRLFRFRGASYFERREGAGIRRGIRTSGVGIRSDGGNANVFVRPLPFCNGRVRFGRGVTHSLADHPCADFRYASVHGLMPHDTPAVVDALVKLCRDVDRDVRDWATPTRTMICAKL